MEKARRLFGKKKHGTEEAKKIPGSASAPIPEAAKAGAVEIPPMPGKMRFRDLNLPAPIVHATDELGFKYCTPIQAAALPKALEGEDVTGRAQTGTGKTAAFLLTIFAHLVKNPADPDRKRGTPRALILAPTRELVMQIAKDAHTLAQHTKLSIVPVFGGMGYDKQRTQLGSAVDIVAATPGRLLDFKRSGVIHLNHVEILVIDEADRMLDMGFIPDVRSIVHSTPDKDHRQTLFFSATLTQDVTRLAAQWTKKPHTVEIEPEQVAVDTVDQKVYILTKDKKFALLWNLLTRENLQRVLVFTNRKDETRRLYEKLMDYDINCAMLSGDVAQTKRVRVLEDFREGKYRVLIATDVASRGLHIEGISHVVNYNLPHDPEDYVHRIGRTGRVGTSGISVSFACEYESFYIPDIEAYLGKPLVCTQPDDDWLVCPPRPTGRPHAPYEPRAASHPQRRGGGGRRDSRGPRGAKRR